MSSYTIIGGDLRNVELAKQLVEDKNEVNIYGVTQDKLPKFLLPKQPIEDSVKNADFVIAPLVFSTDDENINTPLYNDKIRIEYVLDMLTSKNVLILGKVSTKVKEYLEQKDISYVDILKREEMTILNAIPTAEGAIQVAMENSQITLHESNCLVLGFGRIGKVLCKMLHGLGANVYAEARKKEDLAWIMAYGYNGLHLSDLGQNVSNMDIIFNTIPSLVLDYDILKTLKKDVLIVDLASKPHGVDFEAAKKLGLVAKLALALPGKVAPKTSSKFMKQTIYNIQKEREV